MRGIGYLVVLAGVAVLATGCGTKVAPADNVAATAAADTQGQSARISETTTMRMQSMTVSYTQTGAFDFAHSRGVLRMKGPGPMAAEERFIPPKVYVKMPGTGHSPLPHGKSWMEIQAGAARGLGAALLGPFGGTDPGDLLSSLKASSSAVTKLGSATVRGVPATEYRLAIDPAKAAARIPAWRRPGFRAFTRSLGAATVPVDVWVDEQNLVRQFRISLHPPKSTGAPAGARITQTVDFYDFGVPVRVTAPPASAVASFPGLARDGMTKVSVGSGASSRPPRASGTLSPAQAAAAEQAVRSFWSALGSKNATAAAQTVLPAERACFRSAVAHGPRFTITSLRIVSAQPAGTAAATVRFTVKARASIRGHSFPVLPQGPRYVQWLETAEAGGHWYVDLGRSTSMPFGPACK